jgi:hypothetical protein
MKKQHYQGIQTLLGNAFYQHGYAGLNLVLRPDWNALGHQNRRPPFYFSGKLQIPPSTHQRGSFSDHEKITALKNSTPAEKCRARISSHSRL